MKRLKYVATSTPGVFKTESLVKTFTKGEVLGNFNENTLTYWVSSALGTEKIKEGKATSRHKLLLKLKKAIQELGAPDLEQETRIERKKANG